MIIQILIALLVALLISSVFFAVLKIRGPWNTFWSIFFILFLVAIAGGTLIETMGMPFYGYYWLPGLFMTLVAAFLLAAVTPPSNMGKNDKSPFDDIDYSRESTPGNPRGAETHSLKHQEASYSLTTGAFFWITVLLLTMAAIMG
ncbi:MAG: hypothetical protein ACNS62_06645 [Candidatus Cyclobacteriaceae bacterium M3_2C_046]